MANIKTTSYNESHEKDVRLHHIFLPGTYGLVSEAIVAFLALILFNISDFSTQFVDADIRVNPLSVWYRPLGHVLDKLDQYYVVQQGTLFVLWAIVGALLYILIYRCLQIFFNMKRSVGSGVEFVREDPEHGFLRWLGSLHDIFVKALVSFAGMAAVTLGAMVCFGIASQELNIGLVSPFPGDIIPLVLSAVGAVLSIRFIVLGLSLLSSRFRSWYTA